MAASKICDIFQCGIRHTPLTAIVIYSYKNKLFLIFHRFHRCLFLPPRLANELLIIKSPSQCHRKDACVRSSKINAQMTVLSCAWLTFEFLYKVRNSIKENEKNRVWAVNKMRIGCEKWNFTFHSEVKVFNMIHVLKGNERRF